MRTPDDVKAMDPRTRRRLLLGFVARVVGVIAATLVVYALLPVKDTGSARFAVVLAFVGLVVIFVVFARQMLRLSRSDTPVLTAVQALCLVFGLFVTLYALVYLSISVSTPEAFSQELNKVGALYFAMTIMSTVGFGDIAAVSDPARIMVMIQMVLGAVLLGTTVKVLGFGVRRVVETAQQQGVAEPHEQPGSTSASG